MPSLSLELLQRLEGCLELTQPWDLDRLNPGLSAEAVDAELESLKLPVPADARMWWSWRSASPGTDELPCIGTYLVLPPSGAVMQYERMVALLAEDAEHPDEAWPATCLPFAMNVGGGTLNFDCSGAEPAPIIAISPHSFDVRPSAPSLGVVVSWWIEAFENRIYTFDRARRWLSEYHLERVPESRRPFV